MSAVNTLAGEGPQAPAVADDMAGRPHDAGRRRPFAAAASAATAIADGLLERRVPGVARRLSRREARVERAAAALFIATSGAMLVAWPAETGDPVAALLLVATYALVARVRFQVGPGLVRPTELVLVPMLFLLPAPAVPVLVAAGLSLSELPEIVARRAHPERVFVAIADSWHALGPAVVVALLAPAEPSRAGWTVYLAALAAQFAVDFVASTLREWLGAGIHPRELAPVLAIVDVVDALLAPIGFLAVLASQVHPQAYLLAAAPGALLALVARERRERIDHELRLARAYRRSTRLLDAHADDLRRQSSVLERSDRGVGGPAVSPLDRAALERLVLTMTVEAVQADCGRLSVREDGVTRQRVALGRPERHSGALHAAEAALVAERAPRHLTVDDVRAVAVPVGTRPLGEHERCAFLSVARVGTAFSPAERELLAHMAAEAAISLENLRLRELMRKTEEELRAILEGVADAVTAEDAGGRLVYVNPAAAHLLGCDRTEDVLDLPAGELVKRLQPTDEKGDPVGLERLPGRQVLAGLDPEPLVVHHRHAGTAELRCSRVKATPVFDASGRARLAISIIEDVTEIKQAEEAQRFLAQSSQVLAGTLQIEETLAAVARLAVPEMADWCAVHIVGERGLRHVAVAHADAAKQALAETLGRDYPLRPSDEHGAARVVRTGEPELYQDIPDELLVAAAQDERHLQLMRSLGMSSAMTVPMRARDHVVGAITLVNAESGRRFDAHDLALALDLGLRAGTAIDNARLYRTRSAIAQTLQASLLPPALPRIPRLETAALYRAAGEGHEVGGDFYDVFSTGKNQWFVIIGDVCGKGAGAAAVTALARYTIRAAVVRRRSPAAVLRWLNDAMLRQQTDTSRFATIACARLDLDRYGVCVTLAIGGHPRPRVLRATGLVEDLGVAGTALGIVPEPRLEDCATQLTRGDALILYTDGLIEAGAPKRVWSPSHLDTVVAAARQQPAQGIVDHLARAAVADADGILRDDLALLALRAI